MTRLKNITRRLDPRLPLRLLRLPFRILSFRRLTFRRVFILGCIVFVAPVAILLTLRGYSAVRASGYIFTLDSVPARQVAIIFGAQVYPSGKPSPMLADRIAAAAKLYETGKVKVLLMTGDNSVEDYNEPEAMRRYAISLGVPDEAIVLDYAGFRTYDSCYRARDIFKVDKVILVTQDFHLDRALLICNGLGIDAVGVAADAMRPAVYTRDSLVRSEIREIPATALSVVDLLTGTKPTYLGDPLPISEKLQG